MISGAVPSDVVLRSVDVQHESMKNTCSRSDVQSNHLLAVDFVYGRRHTRCRGNAVTHQVVQPAQQLRRLSRQTHDGPGEIVTIDAKEHCAAVTVCESDHRFQNLAFARLIVVREGRLVFQVTALALSRKGGDFGKRILRDIEFHPGIARPPQGVKER